MLQFIHIQKNHTNNYMAFSRCCGLTRNICDSYEKKQYGGDLHF